MSAARSGSPKPTHARSRRTRRWFFGASGGTVATAILAACGGAAPAAGVPKASGTPASFGGGTLQLLLRSHFVPAYDTWLDAWAKAWGDTNKVEVSVDHIRAAQMAEKIAAEAVGQSGHDVVGFTRGGEPQLYADHLVDVADLAKSVGNKYGGWIPLAEQWGTAGGTWKGVPDYFTDFPALYRKDLFDERGLKPVDTWDDLLKAGALLKPAGHPIGIAINQTSNDANNSWSSLLWCYGASYVAKDGKTVSIDSRETREALSYAVELYRTAMTDEVLSWDDTGNNQFLASGRGAWIHNQISALRSIEEPNPDLARRIGVSNTPAGPKGRFASVGPDVLGIMRWSKNQPAAKALIADYFASYLDAVKASQGYNQPVLQQFRKKPMAILGEDARLTMLQDFADAARVTGYPGPPTAAAGEVESNWLIPLMVARAAGDGNLDAAVGWAAQKIEAIYAKHK